MVRQHGTKRKLQDAQEGEDKVLLHPDQVDATQLQNIPKAREGLKNWVLQERKVCRKERRSMSPVRASIIRAANAINAAFVAATSRPEPSDPEPRGRPDTDLASRRGTVCIKAGAIETWTNQVLEATEEEIAFPIHPFLREFRVGDVVLGVAEAREKLLILLVDENVPTSYADATNAALLFRHCRMSRSAIAYLETRRPSFVRANAAADQDGNAAAAAQLWRYVAAHKGVLERFQDRLSAFNAASALRDVEATREAFWRLSRMLCKTRIRQTLADGGRVHFELGEGFDYHSAASKTMPGGFGKGKAEDHNGGHFTASELRVVCSIVVHEPHLAERILFWRDTFPLARPADLLEHYKVRYKGV